MRVIDTIRCFPFSTIKKSKDKCRMNALNLIRVHIQNRGRKKNADKLAL